MLNWIDIIVKCDNPAVIKECVAALKDYDEDECEWRKDGDTRIKCSKHDFTLDFDIEQISKSFPSDVITCSYNDDDCEVFTEEYHNGELTRVNLEPNYMSDRIPLNNDNDRDAIYKKAIAFCRRLDTTETDKDGNLSISWFDEQVCYTFEHDGVDAKKYRIVVTKNRLKIDFKVFERLANYNWREIPNNTNEVDIPF